ncbi:AEC family transporter [Pseudovibrio exalbescens]|uniref:Malonate transporter n=1 Tax=Pseudovibrio exalbescens TaxID=197461 RepID=A0A1U7JFA3_9HYPH|nr:AEC family transporter [Pseudovibrio exalbescens]OKL43430.1 malonate transporter [Pseudovibrio exalbescens]
MLNVLNLALPFFLLIFIGYVSGKRVKLPQEGLAWINFFVLYIALPALFFQLLSETPLEELATFDFVAGTTAATFIAFVLSFVAGKVLAKTEVNAATVQALVGSYSNIGYMGPGVTLAVLGASATVPTALILCFDTILLFILVPMMMSLGGTARQPAHVVVRQVLFRIATHPFIVAVFAGILAAAVEFQPPVAIDTLLTYLRNAAAPCALFAMGVTIALQPARRRAAELPVLLVIKLVLHPVLVYFILTSIGGFQDKWVYTGVLMASLPPAANVYVLAQQYHAYVERASTAVLIGTMASVLTVPVVIYLITHGYLL